MKNSYEIREDVVAIRISSRWERHECLVDVVDLERVKELRGTWYASPARGSTTKFYVNGKVWDREAGNSRTVLLHRWILGEVPGREVNHRDNDGLNNRRGNLEQLTHKENMRWMQPERDWSDFDGRRALAKEYRVEREVASAVQVAHKITRQGVFKIRRGATRGSLAAVDYHDRLKEIGVRSYELLARLNPVEGKWGAVNVKQRV